MTGTYQPPQDGQPCYEYENSQVALGAVTNGQRQIAWYEPNNGAVLQTAVPDQPFAQQGRFTSPPAYASVLYASVLMGSGTMTIHYELDGTWSVATKTCKGTWTVPADRSQCQPNVRCDLAFHLAALGRRQPLAYQTPPALNVEQLVATATVEFRQVYTGGHVNSTPPGNGQIVHYPSCFTEQAANVPRTVGFSIRDPQSGTGAVLVVNYVVEANVDEVWWDFGEPENPVTVQEGTDPGAPCSARHTYAHVSADAYGSNHIHHPPPGVTWTFGDAEPAPDMQAVDVWQHVHFSVTAYYQQPDGSQYAQQLAVNNGGDDFWLAATPEWVRVYQIEGVPDTP